MKSILLTTALFATMVFPAAAQFDMLGKNLAQICARIDNDPEYEPKIDTLIKLSDVLGVTVDELIRETTQEEIPA